MSKIHIEKTKTTPEISLDLDGGAAEIKGESYPENAVAFYKPVFEWLNEAIKSKKPFTFNFKLNYFNTSSSKSIIDILDHLEKYHSEGGKVSVKWFYKDGDDDMMESGDEFKSGLKVSFEIVSY